jgi:hypothetical protein
MQGPINRQAAKLHSRTFEPEDPINRQDAKLHSRTLNQGIFSCLRRL